MTKRSKNTIQSFYDDYERLLIFVIIPLQVIRQIQEDYDDKCFDSGNVIDHGELIEIKKNDNHKNLSKLFSSYEILSEIKIYDFIEYLFEGKFSLEKLVNSRNMMPEKMSFEIFEEIRNALKSTRNSSAHVFTVGNYVDHVYRSDVFEKIPDILYRCFRTIDTYIKIDDIILEDKVESIKKSTYDQYKSLFDLVADKLS